MARMSIDDSALRNPKVLRLGKQLGWSRRETLGALLDVWAICYDRVTAYLPAEDIDTAAERDGFAAALIAVGLADDTPDGVRCRGAEGRIEYLAEQAERGRKGGLTRAANEAKRKEINNSLAYASSTAVAPAKASFKPPDPVPDLPSASAPDPVPDLAPPDQRGGNLPAAPAPRSRKTKEPSYTEAEQLAVRLVLDKLSSFSGVTYRGAAEHTKLIVARLRDGLTTWDLRRVIGYCALKLEWEKKPNMRGYLRPETLFGPEAIQRYLDPARSWEPNDTPPEERPQLRLVEPPMLALAADNNNQTEDLANERWEEPEWMTNA